MMDRDFFEHVQRVLPQLCKGGVERTFEEVVAIFEQSDAIFLECVDGVIRAHAEATRNPVSPHRWSVSCAVEEGFEGMGLGRKVLSAALAHADARGAEYVDGWAWASNHVVLALDHSLGFRDVCVVPDAYRRDGVSYDQVLMVRRPQWQSVQS